MARILIVDDDLLCRNIMTRALQQRGHDTRAVSDGPSAREMLRESRFDALICDMVLPGESGLQVVKDARGSHPDLKVIAVSGGKSDGKALPFDVLNTVQMFGTDAVVRKPFSVPSFVDSVERALKH